MRNFEKCECELCGSCHGWSPFSLVLSYSSAPSVSHHSPCAVFVSTENWTSLLSKVLLRHLMWRFPRSQQHIHPQCPPKDIQDMLLCDIRRRWGRRMCKRRNCSDSACYKNMLSGHNHRFLFFFCTFYFAFNWKRALPKCDPPEMQKNQQQRPFRRDPTTPGIPSSTHHHHKGLR